MHEAFLNVAKSKHVPNTLSSSVYSIFHQLLNCQCLFNEPAGLIFNKADSVHIMQRSGSHFALSAQQCFLFEQTSFMYIVYSYIKDSVRTTQKTVFVT